MPWVVRMPVPSSSAPPLKVAWPLMVMVPAPPRLPLDMLNRFTASPAPFAVKLPPLIESVPATEEEVEASPSVSAPPAPMVNVEPATVFKPLTTMPGPESVTFTVPTLM